MIHLAVAHVVAELNAYLNLRAPAQAQNRVLAGSLHDLNGEPEGTSRDRLVVLLANLEEERVYRDIATHHQRPDGVAERTKPRVRVNLYLLFVANFAKYDEALKALALAVTFFQHRVSFEVSDPGGGERVRLSCELDSMTFEQQNHLWASLGAKYMPSVLYKCGILDLRDVQVEAEVPPVEEIVTED